MLKVWNCGCVPRCAAKLRKLPPSVVLPPVLVPLGLDVRLLCSGSRAAFQLRLPAHLPETVAQARVQLVIGFRILWFVCFLMSFLSSAFYFIVFLYFFPFSTLSLLLTISLPFLPTVRYVLCSSFPCLCFVCFVFTFSYTQYT